MKIDTKGIYVLYRCRDNCGYATSNKSDAEKHAEKHSIGRPWEPEFFVKVIEPCN